MYTFIFEYINKKVIKIRNPERMCCALIFKNFRTNEVNQAN